MDGWALSVMNILRDWRVLAGATLICLVFVFIGPFDNLGGPYVWQRFLFWGPLFTMGVPIGAVACVIVDQVFAPHDLVQRRIFIAIAFSFLFAPIFEVNQLLHGIWAAASVWSFFCVLALTLFLAITMALFLSLPDVGRPASADINDKTPRLLHRLKNISADTQVARLTVQDHYVLVCLTDGTEHRLLMRLSDAIAEMDCVKGYTTHRSHWVSEEAIAHSERVGTRDYLVLSCGTSIPVSRTYRGGLVSAGLI